MDNKSSNIKERVLQITDFKGVSKEKFFNEIGMTYGNFKGKSKETPLNSNAVADILTKYPDINPTWLLTGNGPMTTGYSDKEENFNHNIVAEPIPFYGIEASAGIVSIFQDHSNSVPIDHIQIPNLPKCKSF
jgi:hypothetical protein